jgi:hypothetical protein
LMRERPREDPFCQPGEEWTMKNFRMMAANFLRRWEHDADGIPGDCASVASEARGFLPSSAVPVSPGRMPSTAALCAVPPWR